MHRRSGDYTEPKLKHVRSIHTGFANIDLDTPQSSESDSSLNMNTIPLAIGHATDRQENGTAIVQQGRIQLNNPSLPSNVKQQLFQTLTQIDAFGEAFAQAPVPIYNILILQIKACLAHAIGGAPLAQHQIRTASKNNPN